MEDNTGAIFGMILITILVLAWFTHILYCLGEGAWGFLLAGAMFFPIGIIHGVGLWFGAF